MVSEPALLRTLLGHLEDGAMGYEKLSGLLRSEVLQARFREEAQVRAAFTAELKRMVPSLSQNAPQSGTTLGAAHRFWLELKTAIADGGDDALLGSVVICEGYMLRTYHAALQDTGLPRTVREILEQQLSHIQRSIDLFEDFRRGVHV